MVGSGVVSYAHKRDVTLKTSCYRDDIYRAYGIIIFQLFVTGRFKSTAGRRPLGGISGYATVLGLSSPRCCARELLNLVTPFNQLLPHRLMRTDPQALIPATVGGIQRDPTQ